MAKRTSRSIDRRCKISEADPSQILFFLSCRVYQNSPDYSSSLPPGNWTNALYIRTRTFI